MRNGSLKWLRCGPASPPSPSTSSTWRWKTSGEPATWTAWGSSSPYQTATVLQWHKSSSWLLSAHRTPRPQPRVPEVLRDLEPAASHHPHIQALLLNSQEDNRTSRLRLFFWDIYSTKVLLVQQQNINGTVLDDWLAQCLSQVFAVRQFVLTAFNIFAALYTFVRNKM